MMAMTRENLRGNLNEVHEGGFRWLITTTLLLGVSDNVTLREEEI